MRHRKHAVFRRRRAMALSLVHELYSARLYLINRYTLSNYFLPVTMMNDESKVIYYRTIVQKQ